MNRRQKTWVVFSITSGAIVGVMMVWLLAKVPGAVLGAGMVYMVLDIVMKNRKEVML